MDDYSNKSVLVVDNGLFAFFAETLAKSFGKTQLFIPWANAYPKSRQRDVGKGLDGVERVDHLWPHAEWADLVVFPDIYFGDLQKYLADRGKRVWGSRLGEDLELQRAFSKERMRACGVPIKPYQVVTGILALREWLKGHDNQYVKVSTTRGDMETFKAESYDLAEPRLDELEHSLGARKGSQDFIVEDEIGDAVEVGYDGFTVDGEFPRRAMCGIEIKDKGYVGHFTEYAKMPEPIRDVNACVAPLLRGYQYRNFWAAEARITDDKQPWVIDPCARSGSPPSELQAMMYTNLADIFWHGATGEVVDPVPAGEWGAELMIVSAWASDNWQSIEIPDQYRENVKLHFPVRLDDRWYVAPQGFDLPAIGAVVAVGKTAQAAMDECKRIAEQVKGYYLDIQAAAFDSADEEMGKLKKLGMSL